MKKYLMKASFLSLVAIATLMTSCDTSNDLQENDSNSIDLAKAQAHAVELGYKANDITVGAFKFPDGSSEQRVFLQDDASFTEADFYAYNEVAGGNPNSIEKQYRTTNLVTGANRTIDILGFNANNANGLSAKAQNGLRNAVNNYNVLTNSVLRFRLTFGSTQTAINAADMVVYDNSASTSNQGGVAGFPTSSGLPNKFVQIFNLEGFTTDVNEHVITHEIGHSVGFRHSDWFSRQTCGQSGEAAGSAGAIRIGNTPSGFDPTSIMNACFSANSNGEFNANDKAALGIMY